MVTTSENSEPDERHGAQPPPEPSTPPAPRPEAFPQHSDAEISQLFDSIVAHIPPPTVETGPPSGVNPAPRIVQRVVPDSAWRSYSPPEESDEFVPPPALAMPRHDLQFWVALGGSVCGPLLLIYAFATHSSITSLPMWSGFLFTVGGFAAIVMRAPTEPRDEDDNGAQV